MGRSLVNFFSCVYIASPTLKLDCHSHIEGSNYIVVYISGSLLFFVFFLYTAYMIARIVLAVIHLTCTSVRDPRNMIILTMTISICSIPLLPLLYTNKEDPLRYHLLILFLPHQLEP